jgi:Notch-like protein
MADLINTYTIKDTNPYIDNSMKHLNKHSDKSISNITWKYATTREMEKIVKSVKNTNSSGYDEIAIRLLKLSIPYIISPLSHICNSALGSGVFPNRLKYAIVMPIHKKGDPHLISNYIPISILNCFFQNSQKINIH